MSTEYLSRFRSERPHPSSFVGGVQRFYDLGNGYGLSLINGAMLHCYPFAWEAAVIKGLDDDGSFADIVYDTPLTADVEVFSTEEEADDFIRRAFEWAASSKVGGEA
jgi:hypothetical protein